MNDEPAIDTGGGFVRLRLDIAYDGTEFAGWAAQAGQRTVAGVLDDALSTVFRTPVQLRAAGRTDAGVHATGQVATSTCPPTRCLTRIRARRARAHPSAAKRLRSFCRWCGDWRAFCPPMCGSSISAAPQRVSMRGSRRCAGITCIGCRPRRTGSNRSETRFVTAWPRPLDVDAMAAASRDLLGLHDFAAFCRHREGATTIRDLQRLDWSRDGDRVTAHVTADAFCWSMVRSLVGALLAVGEHRREPGWCATLLDVDAALQRLRRRAAAGTHAGRRRLPARRPARGPHQGHPRSAVVD